MLRFTIPLALLPLSVVTVILRHTAHSDTPADHGADSLTGGWGQLMIEQNGNGAHALKAETSLFPIREFLILFQGADTLPAGAFGESSQ